MAGDSDITLEIVQEQPITLDIVADTPIILELMQTGPAGTPGTDANYVQAFSSVSSVVVTHNLNKQPAVTIIDTAGDECEGQVIHDSLDQCTVYFSSSFSGMIICN